MTIKQSNKLFDLVKNRVYNINELTYLIQITSHYNENTKMLIFTLIANNKLHIEILPIILKKLNKYNTHQQKTMLNLINAFL